jgi:hypothetical protein
MLSENSNAARISTIQAVLLEMDANNHSDSPEEPGRSETIQ